MSFPFDLHVLSMPPAFNLSQDQTLHLNISMTEVIYPCESSKPDQFSLSKITVPYLQVHERSCFWTYIHTRRPHKSPAHIIKDRFSCSWPGWASRGHFVQASQLL